MGKHLFGISTLIMSIALLIWSIGETFAFPQGPNVSLGSNPVVWGVCGQNTPWTNNNALPVVVTDLLPQNTQSNIYYNSLSSNAFLARVTEATSLTTGFTINPGEIIYCYGQVSLFGYLAHQ